jgi:alanyl-tRNA synthetase
MSSGATALFGEKYGESVRVVRVGEVSMELCGGTHVNAAGDIGFFKITSEAGIAAGVRRIEAVTGVGAVRFVQQLENEQNKLAGLVKAEGGGILDRVERILGRQKELQREVETLQAQLNAGKSADLLAAVREIGGVRALAVEVSVDDVKKLRELSDSLKDRLGSGIIALGANIGGKATLLVTVSGDLTSRFKAGELIRQMAPIVGGSGGGKPEMAQAGGTQTEKLTEAVEQLYSLII